MIDVDQFLNAPVKGAMDTKFTPVPEDDYVAMIPQGGIGALREVEVDGDKKLVVDLNWQITDEEKLPKVKQITGMKSPRVKQSVFLDVIVDSKGEVKGLDGGKGKNIDLGRLREALKQNDPSKDWTFRHLEGAIARIKVAHRQVGDATYSQVAKNGVTAL